MDLAGSQFFRILKSYGNYYLNFRPYDLKETQEWILQTDQLTVIIRTVDGWTNAQQGKQKFNKKFIFHIQGIPRTITAKNG